MRSSLYVVFLCCSIFSQGQNVELFDQFNGRYDYVAIGNTMNVEENGPFSNCTILTSSTANLTLADNQTIQAAYLYWAGSGLGDFEITLNGNSISAERTFSDALDDTRIFFAAFTDITDLVIQKGNGDYTVEDLNLSNVIEPYCSTGTNFGGWAITVIYEDSTLPLNQINIYDGLQSVPTSLTIVLDSLNVFDNEDAKIGFIAWEGDGGLAVNETLTINGNVIGNPPLNPIDNAFNGTNSFTGQSDLYNMDIDVYNIQNNINIGDTSATIQLTSGQDFVMINNIITVLNSQLPDATTSIDDYFLECNNRTLEIDYSIHNLNSTAELPANTPIAFYANDILVAQSVTLNTIAINASEINSIILTLPDEIGLNISLEIRVDDLGNGNGIINEIVESNNSSFATFDLLISEPIIFLDELLGCDIGFDTTTFDLTSHFQIIGSEFNPNFASFYSSIEDAEASSNEILIPANFTNSSNPQTIILRIESDPCYQLFQFDLLIENCPPTIPQGFSPNNDGYNDWFNIQGLYDIFEDHELLIFNRHGTRIFKGNNLVKWDGRTNMGLNSQGKLVPVGTYFYVLYLNDSNYEALSGWVYVNY